jgi:hypothetical protein
VALVDKKSTLGINTDGDIKSTKKSVKISQTQTLKSQNFNPLENKKINAPKDMSKTPTKSTDKLKEFFNKSLDKKITKISKPLKTPNKEIGKISKPLSLKEKSAPTIKKLDARQKSIEKLDTIQKPMKKIVDGIDIPPTPDIKKPLTPFNRLQKSIHIHNRKHHGWHSDFDLDKGIKRIIKSKKELFSKFDKDKASLTGKIEKTKMGLKKTLNGEKKITKNLAHIDSGIAQTGIKNNKFSTTGKNHLQSKVIPKNSILGRNNLKSNTPIINSVSGRNNLNSNTRINKSISGQNNLFSKIKLNK